MIVGGFSCRWRCHHPRAYCVSGMELMRKRILADYERDAFSGEVPLRLGQEHPKVRGTEQLGFAKLDLYRNTKPKSVKPIRLVGERAAAEQEVVEDVLARGWIEPCPASEWASNGFVVPKKEKGKWRLVVDYRQPERFIVVSTLCFASPAACCWCRVSCCLFLEMKSFCLLKYSQSRIAQARGMQGEENQDQSMKGCSVNSER